MNNLSVYRISELVDLDKFPILHFIPTELKSAVFENFYFVSPTIFQDGEHRLYAMQLYYDGDLTFSLPTTDIFKFHLGNASEGLVNVEAVLALGSEPSLTLQNVELSLSIAPSVLTDLASGGRGNVIVSGDLRFSTEGIGITRLHGASLSPALLFNTGIIVEAEDVVPQFEPMSLSFEDEDDFQFFGVEIQTLAVTVPLDFLGFPADSSLRFAIEDASISETGFSGEVSLDASEFSYPEQSLLHGLPLQFREIAVDILDNIPVQLTVGLNVDLGILGAAGVDKVLLLDAGLGQSHSLSARLEQELEITLDNNGNYLRLTSFAASGVINDTGFQVQGLAGVSLKLHQIQFNSENIEIRYEQSEQRIFIQLAMAHVNFGVLGQSEGAELHLEWIKDASGSYSLHQVFIQSQFQWEDILQALPLDDYPAFLPLPPSSGQALAKLSWQEDQQQVTLHAELEEVDQLWRFIPVQFRPEVGNATLDIYLANNGNDFDGELGVSFTLRLPDLATLLPSELSQYIDVDSGDEEGWIGVRFTLSIEQNNAGEDSASVKANLDNPIAIALQLPGLILPEAPIRIMIDKVSVQLDPNGDDTSGAFAFDGQFVLRPVLPDSLNGFVPPFIAQQLDQLLAIAHSMDLSGQASMSLGFSSDNLWFTASCQFDQANLELDLFDMLTNLLSGGGNLLSDSGSEIDLDIDVGMELKSISLSLGSEQAMQDADSAFPFAFGMAAELRFAGQFADFEFELTDQALKFGLAEATIPIAIPKLPLSLADLDRLKDAGGQWDYDNNWLGAQGIEQEINGQIDALNESLQQARELLEQLLEGQDQQAIFQQQYRVIPAIQAQLFQLVGRKFLYEAVLAVHQMLGVLGVQGSQQTYQTGIEIYQGAVDIALGWLHVDTQLQFKISNAMFVLPFNNPSDIRVEGSASIIGFAPDDPLAALGDLQFTLGLSADAIYFSVEGGANPIPLPDFGRYPGSAINLDRLAFGYGYSKNSLMVDFAGELILSPQLIEDVDTSNALGFGVRLPVNNKLQFKLDLIPITLGEVEFILPLIAFDIDLRSDFPPPLPISNSVCQPHWDGLQVIAKDLFRADFKRFKVSPFLGPIMSTNVTASFDIQIGNAQSGISHICDNYFVILPMTGAPTVPFLNDGVPYFDRYCIAIHIGGFGLSIDLTRPFPQPSPLLIFELMGFIADPSVPIDPNGHIANVMYAELYNARISLPSAVAQMFPVTGGVANKDFSGRINVATVIALGQQILQIQQAFFDQIADTTANGLEWLDHLQAQVAAFTPKDILALLPPELRRIDLQGRFVHFDADASFWLMDASDFSSEQSDDAVTDPVTPSETWEQLYLNKFDSDDLSDWRPVDFGLKRGKGDWQIQNGKLKQLNNVGDNSPARYGSMLIYQNEDVSNIRLQVVARSKDNDGLGVVFHVQSKDSFYRFRMTQEQQQWDVVRLNKGSATELHRSESQFQANTDYTIRVETRKYAGQAIGLNRRFSDFNGFLSKAEITDLDASLKRLKKVRDRIHIKIWVNDALWCDVIDDGDTLSHGHVGLDSWWNKGVQFDDIQLWHRKGSGIAVGKTIQAEHLNALSAQLSSQSAITELAFYGFDTQDIAAAMAQAPEFAVVVTANIRLFGSQRASMLGYIGSGGQFKLVSRLDVDTLELPIAGLQKLLYLQAVGRIQLSGRRGGADSWVNLEASTFADWTILGDGDPDQAVVRLLLGSETQPVTLSMSSELAFGIRGNAQLRLFAGQIILTGEADISQNHVLVAGQLVFDPAAQAFGNTQVMQLQLICNGRIGPGQDIDLSGTGQLSLLGKDFSSASVKLGNNTLQIKTALTGNNQVWALAGLSLSKVHMQLTGLVDFSENTPQFAFSGECDFRVLDATIEGRCKLEVSEQHSYFSVQGSLFWQGRNWLDGGVVIRDSGLTIEGKADFSLDLTPQLPAGIELAGLYFNAAVSGNFELNNQGQLVAWQFDLNWQLGVKLPGMQNKQLLPIAAQQFKVQGSHAATNNRITLFDLIQINGLSLFDLGTVTLPIPELDYDNGTEIYLRNNLDLDVDGEGASFTFLTPVKPSPDSQPVFDFVIKVYEDEVAIDVPEVSIPIPVLSDTPQNANDNPLFVMPTFSGDEQQVNLGQLRLDDVQLNLQLAWQDGELGIWVVNNQTFVSFKQLQLFPVGFFG